MQYYDNAQIDVLNQKVRNKFLKIEILDFNYKIIESIEGLVEDGSISEDANNDNRKSASITLIIPPVYSSIIQTQFGNATRSPLVNDKFSIQKGGIIWIDKYIRIYVGIKNIRRNNGDTQDIEWFDRGIFIIDAPSLTYSLSENKLVFNGLDLMAQLTSDRYGQLPSITTTIPAINYGYNSNGEIISKTRNKFRDAFIYVLTELGGIANYFIAAIPSAYEFIPIDISINVGGTVYDLLKKMRDQLPQWEMFFDNDGIFRLQPIPDGENDIIYPLNSDNTQVNNISVDFSFVKNQVIIYGKTQQSSYSIPSEKVSISGSTLILKIDEYTPNDINTYQQVEFVWLNQYNSVPLNALSIISANPTITTTYKLIDFEGDIAISAIPINKFEPNKAYVLRYITDGVTVTDKVFEFLSNDQVSAVAVESDPNSPYYINYYLQSTNFYGGYTFCADNINFKAKLNNITPLTAIMVGTQISFMPNTYNSSSATLTIQNNEGVELLSAIPVGNYYGTTFIPLPQSKWGGDYTIFYVTYSSYTDTSGKHYYFEYNGRLKALTLVLSGGRYDSLYSTQVCLENATYELYLRSNMNDSVNISTIPNYILEVNKKIYDVNKLTGIASNFLIKNITLPLGINESPMSINAIQLYNNIPK